METAVHPQTINADRELAGLQLLVIEDDYLVAADLCAALRSRGAVVIGPAANTDRIGELTLGRRLDCALLDVNLNGAMVFDLATRLRHEGVPTIFITGYDAAFLPESLWDAPCLQKPVNISMLVRLIRSRLVAQSVK